MAILTHPSPAELASFAAFYGLGELRSAHGIQGGTVNTSYKLEAEDGRIYFLRIYEEQGQEGAEREAVLLDHLASSGVPTPAPIRGHDGKAVRTIAKKPGALFPWVDGDILCQKRMTREAAGIGGAALARIHHAGPPPGGISEGRFRPSDIAARCDRVATSSDERARDQASSLREAVLAFDERRSSRTAPSGLVHGDLFRDNVLWREDKISALLDFESAHFGPFAYDIAVTILSWCYGADLDLDLARAMVDGYRSVRPIEPGDREALFDEAIYASLRFTVTRITDDAIRVGKKWQRFVARREALEALGRARFLEAVGL